MSYIRSSRKILKDRNPELHGKLLNIEKKAQSLLTYTAGKFPYYTPHDFVTHSRNVEENLNWIIDDEVKEKLNSHEIFFLLISAWLHDWGMIGEKGENPEEIRAIHNVRTEKYLEKLHDKVYLSLHEAQIVGKICKGHTKENLLDDYYSDIIFGANIPIHVRFLTACLRIADECDVTANRTPEIIYYSLNPTDKAEEEFKKHLFISGIGRPEKEKHKIQLFGIAWDPKGVKVMERVRDKIQKELNSVKVFLAQQGVVIDYVELKVDTRGFINEPIEFVLDRKKIVELLIGSHLYSRNDCALRELLQNAVDTCRLRKVLEKDHIPSIKFCFSKEKICFEDNGLGMNFGDAQKFLSRKGSSFYVSKEIQDLLRDRVFVPISKFGIGVLSCFLIASKVTIESKKRDCAACRFIIENLAEGWRYEEGGRRTEGTLTTLFLNDEGKGVDVEKALIHYAKKIEIPITLVNEDTGESKILQQQWNASMPEVKKAMIVDIQDKKFALPPIQDDVALSQTIQSDGIESTYVLLRKGSHYRITERNCFLSYQGIYVGNFDFIPSSKSNWFVLVNCSKELLDIAVSRENIIMNAKSRSFIQLLYNNFLKFVDTIASTKRDKVPHDFNCCMKYASTLDNFLADYSMEQRGSPRSELILRVALEKIYPVLDSNCLRFVKGKDVLSDKNVKRIYLYILPSVECKHHIGLVTPFFRKLISEEEVVVFDIGPHFSLYDPLEHVDKSALLILCENEGVDFDSFDLFKVLRSLHLKKVNTPLDALLPGKSSFVKIPKKFRSFVIYKKPYKFDVSKTELSYRTYGLLLGREFFLEEPTIAKAYTHELGSIVENEIKKISDGEFLYDADDSLLKLVLENAEKIVSDSFLQRLVWIYLRHLAHSTTFFPVFMSDWSHLWSLEKIIMAALVGGEKHQTLFERIGKMGDVLKDYRGIPSTKIYEWIYSG